MVVKMRKFGQAGEVFAGGFSFLDRFLDYLQIPIKKIKFRSLEK
jgi:hypothetical protein